MAVVKTQRMHLSGRNHPTREPMWIGWIKPLFILLLVVLFFLLAQSMLHHHFFSGSRFLHPDSTSSGSTP